MTNAPGRTRPILLGTVAAALLVYWLTAYPTITWWDSSQYSLAAATLGTPGPPGSLLLTLLGWVVAQLPFGSVAHTLNVFAGVLAAGTIALVYLVVVRLGRMTGESGGSAALVGAALGALALGFGDTLWQYATQFTPYVLTAVFTGLILYTLLRWWEKAESPDAWRRLAVLALLFGLDFSVHRTNALLIPGAILWVLVRRPRTFRDGRAWLGAAGGMAVGLAVQFVLVPIALTSSSILNNPTVGSWSGFWDYVSLQERGGGFLFGLFPRHAPIWSVQTMDLLRVFAHDFFSVHGMLGPLGLLPGLAGVFGLVVLWRRNRRLAIAFKWLLVLQAAGTILYFNIPATYFRSFDRHYLPVCVTFAVLVAYGLGAVLGGVARVPERARLPLATVGGLAALLVAVTPLVNNWSARDDSNQFFAQDFATNLLEGLPPKAVLFTAGDNDTFPLWYVHSVERVRPDVEVVNLSLANTVWYVDALLERDPSFPISLSHAERTAFGMASAWHDTTIVVPVEGTGAQLGLTPGTPVPTSIALDAKPSFGNRISLADRELLDIVETNRWRRPLCFSLTVGADGMGALRPYGRQDGLYWRIVPVAHPKPDLAVLRWNVLGAYNYRGYADPHARLDGVSRNMAALHAMSFLALLRADSAAGDTRQCVADGKRLEAVLPAARWAESSTALAQMVGSVCGSKGGS